MVVGQRVWVVRVNRIAARHNCTTGNGDPSIFALEPVENHTLIAWAGWLGWLGGRRGCLKAWRPSAPNISETRVLA